MENPACFTQLKLLSFERIALAHSLLAESYHYTLSNQGYGIYGKTPPQGGILEVGFVEQNPVLLSGQLGEFLIEENGIFIIPPGSSGEIFGLYATTGRVASPLAPLMFGLCVGLGARFTGAENTQYFGIIGIAVVLVAGLLVLLALLPRVPVPRVAAGAARD